MLWVGSSVLRHPSFEEKYCVSPASSRSNSPSSGAATAAFYDQTSDQQTFDANTTADVQSSTRASNSIGRDAYRAGGVHELTGGVHSSARTSGIPDVTDVESSLYRTVDSDLLSTAGRPFVAVTSRTRSPVVVSSRPVSGPTRQFITSPPPPPPVIPGGVVSQHGISGVSAATSVNPMSVGFQIAAATALPPPQLSYATSPLDSWRDVTVTSSCSAPVPLTSNPAVGATARSSRPPTIVLQQVHSWEVAWPTVQKATAPLPTRATGERSYKAT